MSNYVEALCDELVAEGHLEKVSEGIYQKTGGHGYKMDVSSIALPEALPEHEEFKRQLKVTLLAIMERPDIMGTPVDPDDPVLERIKKRRLQKWWKET